MTIRKHNPGKFGRHALAASLSVALCIVSVGESRGQGSKDVLELGYTLAYEDAVKRKDVRVAISYLLTKALAGDGIKVNFTYFDGYREGMDAVLEGKVSASEVPGHYLAGLDNDRKGELRGLLVPQRHESATSEYFLLAQSGKELSELQGGALRVVSERNRGLAPFWLDVELAERFDGKLKAEFFSEVTECEKPSDALLPTFFGKAEACVISRGDFELLTELNPQISKRLSIIARSEKLVPMVLALREGYEGIDVEAAITSATTLHTDADGQQALTLMQVCRFSRFDETLFEPTRDLVRRAKTLGVELK